MAGKIFRMIAAFTMLVLYTTVMAASDVVALTCHCNSHRSDVHTAFNHVHKCEAEHCDHHGDSHSEDTTQQLSKHRCCNHNHSNDIALYIQPRTSDDDHSECQAILLAVVTDAFDYNDAHRVGVGCIDYGEYLLPSLLEGYTCSGALRAPPALV